MNTLQIPLVYVCSDNFDGYMTKDAYKEFRLQMSTGDFHVHAHVDVLSIDPMTYAAEDDVYDILPDDYFNLEVIGKVKDFIKKGQKQMKYIIKDWANNICFFGKEFDSFEDAWGYIYEKDPNTKDDDHYYDDYFVEEKTKC